VEGDFLTFSYHATAIVHPTGNGRISTASVIAAGCRPSRIASTMSGASRVRRRTRPPLDSAHGENEIFRHC
jgi:hypothetical protein